MSEQSNIDDERPRRIRTRIRTLAMKATLTFLRESGFEPTALDVKPDGSFRWHIAPPTTDNDAELDRELAEFQAKHGHG